MADHIIEPAMVRAVVLGAGARARLAVEFADTSDGRAHEATRALVDGDLPSAPSVASGTAGKFRTLLRTVDFSPSTRKILEDRLALLDRLPALVDRGQVPAPASGTDDPQSSLPGVEGQPPSNGEGLDALIDAEIRMAMQAGGVHETLSRDSRKIGPGEGSGA